MRSRLLIYVEHLTDLAHDKKSSTDNFVFLQSIAVRLVNRILVQLYVIKIVVCM